MKKWINELKMLTSNKDVIAYYQNIIGEENLHDYNQICNEIGTPKQIFEQERANNNIKPNQVIKIAKNTGNGVKNIFASLMLFVVSILLFTSICMIIAGVLGTIFLLFSQNSTFEDWLQILFTFVMIFVGCSLALVFQSIWSNLIKIIKKQQLVWNKKLLTIALGGFLIVGVFNTIIGFQIYNVQRSYEVLKEFKISNQEITSINVSNAKIKVVSSNKNEIIYKAYQKGVIKNGNFNLNDNKITIGLNVHPAKEREIIIKANNMKNIKIEGMDNKITFENIKYKDLKVLGVDNKITINNSNLNKVKIDGIDKVLNINKSNIKQFEVAGIDQKINVINSRIEKLIGSEDIQNITLNNSIINKK